MKIILKIIFIIITAISLSFCTSMKGFNLFSFLFKRCSNSYDSGYQGHYKLGEPYEINNVVYYPKYDPHYDQVGLASWYGDDFHCRKTANGESFNKAQLSAAHKTLPLPSIVRVTNLHNNKSVDVIVNDRGPFVSNRIIDLSESAAEEIGMKNSGIAKVRVTYLEDQTNMLLAQINLQKHIKYASRKQNNQMLLAQNHNTSRKPIKETLLQTTPYTKKHSSQEIAILVGKYKDKKEALKTVRNLSNIGYAKLSQIINKGKPIYEVQLASAIRNEKQAQSLLKKIIDLGHPNAYFINR